MPEFLLNIINSLVLQDYIILVLSIGFGIAFLFLGLEKLHKSYLGVILGLFLFSIANLLLFSLNQSDVGLGSIKEFFINNRNSLALWTIALIPILAILIPLNSGIYFRLSDRKGVIYLSSFLLGFLYIPFLFTIFLSILNNRFLFSIDPTLLENINQSFVGETFIKFFENSTVFNFLKKYDYIINLIVILYVFYKMTIGGIIDFLAGKIFAILKNSMKSAGNSHDTSHHEESHGHEEHHDSGHHH